jgi:hypothetical protein
MPAPINTLEAQFEADIASIHQFVNDPLPGTITLTGGQTLPNLAKLIMDMGSALPYDIPMYYKGVPLNGGMMARINVVRNASLPINLTGSRATAEVAATASTTLFLKKGTDLATATTIGTITFAAGSKVGTFVFSAEVTLTPADTLYFVNAVAADVTLADISATLLAHR